MTTRLQDSPPALRSAPLGPGSLIWKHFGDRRLFLFAGRAGTMQNMHPAVGAALQDHSNFFANPWDRILRSIPLVLGTIYDDDPWTTAITVRDYHKHLGGVDARGRRYHALNPEVFWWTHVTFVELVIAVNEHFGTPLTVAEKDQVVREAVTWWNRYGLSTRPAVDDYASFQRYWNDMIAHELEANPSTDYAVRIADADVPPPPGVPTVIWLAIRKPVMLANVFLLNALMPPEARRILGLTWSAREERLFRTFATGVRVLWPMLPPRVRYYQRAYQGMMRAGHG